MQLFQFDCAACGIPCERASPRARYCGGRCRLRAFRLRQTRAAALHRELRTALLRGDTEVALQLARRSLTEGTEQ